MLSDADIMAQVLDAFRAEQAEHRQSAGEILLELERDPHQPARKELLDQLFREAHSLKGGARAAGLSDIERLAHRIEDVFAAARAGKLELTPAVCDPIYTGLDAIGALMARHDAGEPTDLAPYQPLLDTLSGALGIEELLPAISSAPALDPELRQAPGQSQARPSEDAPTVRLSTGVLDSLLNEAGELMTCTLRAQDAAREVSALAELPARWRRTWQRIGPRLTRLRAAPSSLRPVVHHLDGRSELGAAAQAGGYAEAPRELIEALEQANSLLSELGAAVSGLARHVAEDHARLAAVTDRLHDQVRRTRMQPLATLFPPLRLQLREMARDANKQIELSIDDGGAEADRQVLDQLREVLMHLLRNAVDHGVESPACRADAAKPPTGTIAIRAEVSGDQLSLSLSDDGAGIDLGAVRERALAAGLIADAEHIEADALRDLIFLPGFSTRHTVSETSGRGVGLDVVRSNVERMRGRVTVQSTPGAGTIFTISVPISLTRSHGLLLRAAGAAYALPLDAVQRIVAVTPAQIQHLEGRPVLRLAERPLPIVSLAELIGAAPPGPPSSGLALILGSGERQVACQIDAVLGEQELVIHRLPAPLVRVRFVSGATILASGQVVPILDVVDLVRAAIGARRSAAPISAPQDVRHTPTVLIVDDSITTRTLEKNILEAAGYQVRLATDGQEALDLLRALADNGGCDLLLSDIDMPRMNGFDLTRQVRGDSRLRNLPVVLVTSLDSPEDRERGVSAGADAYIVKRAFDQQVLLDTLGRLV